MRKPTRDQGEYNVKAQVQRLRTTTTVNAAGHIDETASTWDTWFSRWVSIRYEISQRQGESFAGEQQIARRIPIVRVTSDSETRQITTHERLKIGNRLLSIAEPPRDVKEERDEIEMVCIEVMA